MREQTHYAWTDPCKRTIWVPIHEHKQMIQGRYTYDTRHFTRYAEQTQVMDAQQAKNERQLTLIEQRRWLRTQGITLH